MFSVTEIVLTAKDFAELGFGDVAANLVKLVGAGMIAAVLGGLTTPCTATLWVAAPELLKTTLPE
jgi:hypothetical protein